MLKRLNIYDASLIVLVFVAGLTNFLWFKNDNYSSGVDVHNHLLFSIAFFYKIADVIHNNSSSILAMIVNIVRLLGESLYGDVYWPNGLNFTTSIFYFSLGKSLFSARLSLLPYLFVLFYSTYSIGKLIFSRFIGLLAVLVLFMNPLIFTSSRQYQLDFPLTAMVALSILLLIRTDNFRNRKYSFFFGLSLGWSMLIKGQTMIFMIWPLILTLFKILPKRKRELLRTGQFQNLAIFIIVAGLIASIWWGHQFKTAKIDIYDHIFSKQKTVEANFSWEQKYSFEALSFYSKVLFKFLGPIFFVVFMISFILFLMRRLQYKGLILSWIIPPFILFNLVFSVKHTRFLMPLVPAVALIIAWGLGQIKNRVIRTIIISAVLIYGSIQFYLISYCPWNYREVAIGGIKIFGRLGFGSDYESPPPHKVDYKIAEVARVIRRYAPLNKSVKIASINCAHKPSNIETMYYLKLEDRFLDPMDLTEMGTDILSNFNSLDFILFQKPLKSTVRWPGGEQFLKLLESAHGERVSQHERTDYRSRWERLLKTLEEAESDFQLIAEIPVDENGGFYIYKRIAS